MCHNPDENVKDYKKAKKKAWSICFMIGSQPDMTWSRMGRPWKQAASLTDGCWLQPFAPQDPCTGSFVPDLRFAEPDRVNGKRKAASSLPIDWTMDATVACIEAYRAVAVGKVDRQGTGVACMGRSRAV